jgi:hypothetical protein
LAATNELEQALHNRLDHQPALKQTLDELPLVLADIATLLQTDHVDATAAHDLAHDPNLRPYWTRLAHLIANNEAQAGDVLQEVLEGWPELKHAAVIVQLQKALEQYDFDAAAQALSQL